MKKQVITMIVIVLSIMATVTKADILTFDDVTTAGEAVIPNGYGGLNWTEFGVVNSSSVVPGSGYDNGTVSGSYVAYNRYANIATASDGTFDFIGTYLTAAWNEDLNINLKGYNNNVLIYDQTVVVDPYAPTWFNFNFNNIDELVFDSFGGVNANLGGSGEHFAMDDFAFAIPEPSSMALMTLVSGAGWVIRRKYLC